MKRRRRAGILLHPTSLPGRYGIGDFGPEADRFLEWARSAGLGLWQVLPLHPAPHESPYSASSAFAGNTLLISPERLREEGLLSLPAAQAVRDVLARARGLREGPAMEGETPARFVGGVSRESPPARRARVVPRRARAGRVAGGLGPLRRVEGGATRRLDLVAGGDSPPPPGGARSGAAGARRGDRLPGIRAVALLPPVGAGQGGGESPGHRDPRGLAHLRRPRQRGRLGPAGPVPPGRFAAVRSSSPACRRTRFPKRASSGATRSTAGTRWSGTDSPGGSRACARRSSWPTPCASTTSAGLPPAGAFRPRPSPRSTADGSRLRG